MTICVCASVYDYACMCVCVCLNSPETVSSRGMWTGLSVWASWPACSALSPSSLGSWSSPSTSPWRVRTLLTRVWLKRTGFGFGGNRGGDRTLDGCRESEPKESNNKKCLHVNTHHQLNNNSQLFPQRSICVVFFSLHVKRIKAVSY